MAGDGVDQREAKETDQEEQPQGPWKPRKRIHRKTTSETKGVGKEGEADGEGIGPQTAEHNSAR